MSDRCINCGGVPAVEVAECVVEHNGQTVSFNDPRTVCKGCGNISYVGSQISQHEYAVASIIRQIDGLLSAEELKSIRLKYKLTQKEMEQILSTGPKTWVRWERGKVPQSKVADRFIRCLARDADLMRVLMNAAGIQNAEAINALDEMRRVRHQDVKRALGGRLPGLGDDDLEALTDVAAEFIEDRPLLQKAA